MLCFSIFSVFKLCMFFKLAIHMIFGFAGKGVSFRGWAMSFR